MEIITIYTPTYNREALLHRVYESLRAQTNKNFVWVIIDDGSTDCTQKYIEEIKNSEKAFRVLYYHKENQGVHTARDLAYSVCQTELIFGLDSDDWLFENAVDLILREWEQYKNYSAGYAGIICPKHYSDGRRITGVFPNIESCSFQDLVVRHKCTGDMLDIFRAEVIKLVPNAPIFPGEKLVGERYKIMQIPDNLHFVLCDEQVMAVEYQDTGYSNASYSAMFNNPHGFREDYRQLIILGKYVSVRLKGYLGYISCSLLINDKEMIKGSPHPVITAVLFPFGFISLQYLIWRRKRLNVK